MLARADSSKFRRLPLGRTNRDCGSLGCKTCGEFAAPGLDIDWAGLGSERQIRAGSSKAAFWVEPARAEQPITKFRGHYPFSRQGPAEVLASPCPREGPARDKAAMVAGLTPPSEISTVNIHPQAIVSPQAKLGHDVTIGPFSHHRTRRGDRRRLHAGQPGRDQERHHAGREQHDSRRHGAGRLSAAHAHAGKTRAAS